MKQYEEKYKEIFRYLSLGISRNEISKLLKTSRNTIRKVENAAESLRLTWNDASSMTSEEFSISYFQSQMMIMLIFSLNLIVK